MGVELVNIDHFTEIRKRLVGIINHSTRRRRISSSGSHLSQALLAKLLHENVILK
jgi:hypothetical protein